MGNRSYDVFLHRFPGSVTQLYPIHPQVTDFLLPGFFVLIDRDTDNFQAFCPIVAIQFFKGRHFFTTGFTPGCPKVKQYVFFTFHTVGEADLFPLQVLASEIRERLSDGRSLKDVDTLDDLLH